MNELDENDELFEDSKESYELPESSGNVSD